MNARGAKPCFPRSLATVVSSVRMARSSARPFKKDVLVARVPLLQPNVKEPIPCTGGTEMLQAYMHSPLHVVTDLAPSPNLRPS